MKRKDKPVVTVVANEPVTAVYKCKVDGCGGSVQGEPVVPFYISRRAAVPCNVCYKCGALHMPGTNLATDKKSGKTAFISLKKGYEFR